MEPIQPIEWPVMEIAGRKLTFRMSYSAHVQLARWGTDIVHASILERAAAMAGTFDRKGKWVSEGYEKPIHFADLMEASQEERLVEVVIEALKKVYPELTLSLKPVPALMTNAEAAAQSAKPNGCASGLSELPDPASDSTPIPSGA
jgi:hypothetical protein